MSRGEAALSPEACRTLGGEHGSEAGMVLGRQDLAGSCCFASCLCSVPRDPCCLEGLLTAPSAQPARGEGARGCSVPFSIPALLGSWRSWDLRSITALTVAVG